MADISSAHSDEKVINTFSLNPTKKYVIAQREPWSLPEDSVELPAPPQSAGPPPTVNLLGALLMPTLMIGGMVLSQVLTKNNTLQIALLAPMALMAIGFPLSTLLGYFSQKKKHAQLVEARESNYRMALAHEKIRVRGLFDQQRATLMREYPTVQECAGIGIEHTKRLWWRRPMDADFLTLRIGTGTGKPSLAVTPARITDPNDPMSLLSLSLADEFKTNPDLPLLIDLARTGSVAVAAKNAQTAYEATRRLLFDIMVHHSPLDVRIAILANSRDAEERWSWTKWLPHTGAINSDDRPHCINFSESQIDTYLKWLTDEYTNRLKREDGYSGGGRQKDGQTSIVVVFDDNGIARQSPEIARIAERGHEVNIYLIFAGGQNWPRDCRSRIDVSTTQTFQYVETWDVKNNATQFAGKLETASIDLCERVARSLASLEVLGGQTSAQLPASVRLSQVITPSLLEVEGIKQTWQRHFRPEDLLQFPIGICTNRDRLEMVMINLLPESLGGVDGYHTIIIGTTGSGKSEFLKSIVIGAATRYPPNLLNFFFMDFKGGPTFNGCKNLPHLSGFVTNLQLPELVDRGIESIRNEIDRRQEKFSVAGVQNIWGYNQQKDKDPLPHLILLLDEFTRGLAEFDGLRETLDLLVRQGRSLGMYLILANQDTTSEVDRLLNNVGWRIALTVGNKEEIAMIDRSLIQALPNRAGQGYLRSQKGVIKKFQAGYAGFPILEKSDAENEEFSINKVENNGAQTTLYRNLLKPLVNHNAVNALSIIEEEKVLGALKKATEELGILPVGRIYLDPLPDTIELSEILSGSAVQTVFREGSWNCIESVPYLIIAPVGYIDVPNECLQEILEIDFSRQDGHLWVVGAPGSGKAMTLSSLILSLALTHTPDQVHFYILEFGAGSLRLFSGLPHTGAVIRLQEKERIQRLLSFLDLELEKRSSHETLSESGVPKYAQIFVFINNYAEMRANYSDEAERLSRYVRDGKAAGIHLVITTNRGAELSRNISSNIARKLVLSLANRDEYLDVIGKHVKPLSSHSEGRGYWVEEVPNECQIGSTQNLNIKTLVHVMDKAWAGQRPKPIGIIPSCISLDEVTTRLEQEKRIAQNRIPVGISFENLSIIYPDLSKELRTWLVIGPRESGKSNFLACVANHLLNTENNNWDITALSLRRSRLEEIPTESPLFHYAANAEQGKQILKDLTSRLEVESGKSGTRYIVLIDDLGNIFDPGNEELATLVNSLVPIAEARQDIHIITAGLIEEIRMRTATPIVQALKQNRTGMVFSKDLSELDILGAQIPLEYRRFELPVGRAFFVSKGKPTLVQTPIFGICSGKSKD